MVPLARRNLLAEKTRLLVAVGGVAFAVFLIVLIQGVYLQLRSTFTAFIDDLPAQLWVTQDGAYDVFHSTSLIGDDVAGTTAEVPGVLAAQQVVAGQLRLEAGDGDVRVFAVAFDPVLAGPAGEQPLGLKTLPGPGEVVISELTLRQGGLHAGDSLAVGGRHLRIVDTVRTDLGFRGFAFMDFSDARPLLAGDGSVNYVAVYLADGASATDVAASVAARVPNVSVFTQDEFAASSRAEMSSFNPVLAVLMFVSFIVGAAVISLTIYTATVEKAREFGVMKAIGASDGQLYRVVLFQSLAVGVAGFALGLPIAVVAGNLIGRVVPEFVAMFDWQAVAGVLGGVLVMSVAAAYLPVRRIAAVDPAMVFRA